MAYSDEQWLASTAPDAPQRPKRTSLFWLLVSAAFAIGSVIMPHDHHAPVQPTPTTIIRVVVD